MSCTKTPVETDHTLFLYMPWSTNLTSYFYDNIEDMKKSIERDALLRSDRLIVFFADKEDHAYLYEIKVNDGVVVESIIKEYSSSSFITIDGLASLLNQVKEVAPANRYSMIISAHGMGWLPVDNQEVKSRSLERLHYEYTNGPLTRYFGGLTSEFQTDIPTLASALKQAGIKMEYILFDDCYMSGVEVAYDLKEVSNYIIGCPTEIMAHGFPYSNIFKYMIGDIDYDAITKEFYNFYSTYSYPYATLGIIDCNQVDELALIVKEIYQKYQVVGDSYLDNIQSMDGYTPVIFYDLGDYIAKLHETTSSKDQVLYERFLTQIQKVVPYKTHTGKYPTAVNWFRALTIHNFSGITTSDPSINTRVDSVKDETAWWKATH